jgi:uncharacterized membrane protein
MQIMPDRLRETFLTSIIVALIASTITYIALNPAEPEEFFHIYMLDQDGGTTAFFPDNNSNLTVATELTWRIGVRNFMQDSQYISLRIKMGNSTTPHPNQTTCTPTPHSALYEYRRVLGSNQTMEHNVTWTVLTATSRQNTQILDLELNDHLLLQAIEAVNGVKYRMIIELWVYNPNISDFEWGWEVPSGRSCAWTQIWFNVTTPIS